ncbi:hypothetical protein I4U23_007515 [Adineta vaga]|nr:hypothetical protein I4U23_007515 [Adineta vaga]
MSPTLTEESSASESSMFTTIGDENTTANQSKITQDQTTDSQSSIESSITASTPIDQHINAMDSSNSQSTSSKQRLSTSNLIESHLEDIEQSARSPSPIDVRCEKIEPNEDASSDEHKVEPSQQIPANVSHESDESIVEKTALVLQPVIVSPIDTLPDTVTNRFISSDVYHGYLGDHKLFLLDNTLEVDQDSTTKSLFTALRDSISTPITPLIETIQSVISSMQTTTVPSPSKTESDTNVEVSNSNTQIEQENPVIDTLEESKTILESLGETISTPITAISETIQEAISNLQSDKQELSSVTISSSDQNINDQSNVEPEETSSSKLDHTQKTVSKSIQDVETTNASSTDAHKDDELSIAADTTSKERDVSLIADTTVSTSSDATSAPLEDVTEQNEKQETMPTIAEFSSSSISEMESSSADTPFVEPSTEDTTIDSLVPSHSIEYDDQTSSPIALSSEQNTTLTEPFEIASIDQATGHLSLTEKKDDEQNTLTTITEHTVIPHDTESEQTDTQEILQAETTTMTDKTDVDTSAETKTTFEIIRDVITHPLTTLSEKFHSINSDGEHSKEQHVSSTENTDTVEEKVASTINTNEAQSIETKTTLETIRDVITHPITAITDQIQSVLSTSDSEQTDQTSLNTSKYSISPSDDDDDDNESLTEEPLLETSTTETKTDSTANEDQIERTESKSTFETLRNVITHPLAAITEKIQSIVSPSTNDEAQNSEQQISTTSTDENKDPDIITTEESIVETKQDTITDLLTSTQDLDTHETDQTASDTNQIIQDTIQDLINETIESVLKNLESTTSDNAMSVSNMTWSDLVDEESAEETLNQSFENITEDKIIPDENQSVSINENITEQTIITPQIDDTMQQSINVFQLDSAPTITETKKDLSSDLRETSPVNTEDDPSELIHALQGHSIILDTSAPVRSEILPMNEQSGEHLPVVQEKSSSSTTTTSSQVTSSDRYVSYAIHEMGDSSQERLPSFPIAADIPIYKSDKKTSDESKDQHLLSEPIGNNNQGITKDDDLTELDATENLTSYSDDIHIQKHNALHSNQQERVDASSTDEDVDDENFNEFEQPDISNLYRIIDEITQPGRHEQTYRRYDLSNSSSVSTKPQTDDIYIIPGYPGLWRPSADDDDSIHSGFTNDADDEDEKNQSTIAVKTKTIVRTTNPTQLQSFLKQHQTITDPSLSSQSESVDVFNRPLNEFSFDISESDSFKTCASTINSSSTSKQIKPSDLHQISISEQQEHQTSPDEKILLIRERERGVSLPVTMKIDYDDMALRLSASTPIDASLYSTATETDLPSPSALSEPIQKTTSSSRASTPSLSSNESDQQKLPSSSSWLNNINTITTTTEGPDGPLEARTTIHKSAKGPISIAECEAQGKYILIENTSRSKNIALSGWTLQQENDNGDILTYNFPENCLLRSNQSLKILSKSNETERRNGDLIASLLSSWHTNSNVVTKLINADGKDRASLTKKTLFS